MSKTRVKHSFSNKSLVLYGVVIALLILAIIPRRTQFADGINTAKNADPAWLIVAILFFAMTYLSITVVFMLLAKSKKHLTFGMTLSVSIAASFANRLLPGGVGGVSLAVDYLLHRGYKAAEAGAFMTVNGLVAFVSHMIMFGIALSLDGVPVLQIIKHPNVPKWLLMYLALAILLFVVGLTFWNRFRLRAIKFIRDLIYGVYVYRKSPAKLFWAVLGASVLTMSYVIALYACAQAVGLDISVAQTFVAYTIGIVVGAVVLTPGGLGGVEAGIFASLVAVDGNVADAFSVVLLYRLITFWVPIVPGYLSFVWLRRKHTI